MDGDRGQPAGPWWIMIAGPISADDPARVARNLERLNRAALAVRDKGHVPLIAHHLAAPLRALDAPEAAQGNYLALCEALTGRCDAILLIGNSPGAERERARFAARGAPVFERLEDLPPVGG